MPICGCCCCGVSERGAFGFSNEKSFAYCASAFNEGALSGWAPLPAGFSAIERAPGIGNVMKRAVGRRQASRLRRDGPRAITLPLPEQGCEVRACALRSLVRGTGGCYEPGTPYASIGVVAARGFEPAGCETEDGLSGPGRKTGSTMQDSLDITTIIFLALAVFVIWRLRSVLGQKTGQERPPFDPVRREPSARPGAVGETDNVVRLPGVAPERAPASAAEPDAQRWKGITEPGTRVADGLDAIARLEPGFDAPGFIEGAK